MTPAVDRILDHCDRRDPGGMAGLYLHGSATAGGLRHESDVDLLLVTGESLVPAERRELTDLLLRYSGRRATAEPGRPIELTSVVLGCVTPWTYPPQCDFQYGDWLREQFGEGRLPMPHADPDLAVLFASARASSRALRGPGLETLVGAVPAADLRRAIQDSLSAVLAGFEGDERNVILTLARMVVTMEGGGEIVSKDEAASRVATGLAPSEAAVLDLARRGYLGELVDDWAVVRDGARATTELLAARIAPAATNRP